MGAGPEYVGKDGDDARARPRVAYCPCDEQCGGVDAAGCPVAIGWGGSVAEGRIHDDDVGVGVAAVGVERVGIDDSRKMLRAGR